MIGDKHSKFKIFIVCVALVLFTISCVHLHSGAMLKIPRIQGFNIQDVVKVVIPQNFEYLNQTDIGELEDNLVAENYNNTSQIRIPGNSTDYINDVSDQLEVESRVVDKSMGNNGDVHYKERPEEPSEKNLNSPGNSTELAYFHNKTEAQNSEKDMSLHTQTNLTLNQVARQRTKEILIINATDGYSNLKSYVGVIDDQKCPNLNASMRCRFQFGNEKVWKEADVALFRAFLTVKEEDYWKNRPPGQLWLFDEHESPHKTWSHKRYYDIHIWKGFNLTAVYTSDADIQHYMYAFSCKVNSSKPVVQKNNLGSKKKSVLWMVSNCKWTMGRELYVEELKKYIDVDIVGDCGDRVECGSYGELKFKCVDRLISKYKFYLAFENSFCEGYYTEKVRKTLHVDTIPVVMGSINYTELLAPGAFIDVRDFKSPRELAKYLKKVGNDQELYNKYISTKNSLDCKGTYPRDYMCALCQNLHEHAGERRVYKDMRDFWGKPKRCQSADDFFKDIAPEIVPLLNSHLIFNSTFHPR